MNTKSVDNVTFFANFLFLLHLNVNNKQENNFLQIAGIAKSLRSIRTKVVLPDLNRSANEAMHSSAPIIRPLWMIDPFDPITHTIDDQFLIGDRVKNELFTPRFKFLKLKPLKDI